MTISELRYCGERRKEWECLAAKESWNCPLWSVRTQSHYRQFASFRHVIITNSALVRMSPAVRDLPLLKTRNRNRNTCPYIYIYIYCYSEVALILVLDFSCPCFSIIFTCYANMITIYLGLISRTLIQTNNIFLVLLSVEPGKESGGLLSPWQQLGKLELSDILQVTNIV